MTDTKIRSRVIEFCKSGDIRKVKAIYTMLENEMEENGIWTEEFIKEIERREQSFLDRSAKTYTLEEARVNARARVYSNK